MSLFAIADTHLSFGTNKPMDVFNGWENYENKLKSNWEKIVDEKDTVVIAGDISWAMNIEQAKADFEFLDKLPGRKIILKGNHDYWWATKHKTEIFFKENSIKSIDILFNNAYRVGDFTICGSRGWFFDSDTEHDKKILLREAARLQMSVNEGERLGGEIIIFLHYPPLNNEQKCDDIYNTVISSPAKRCFYGHLHGQSTRTSFNGESDSVNFKLISCDFLGFCPKLIEKF